MTEQSDEDDFHRPPARMDTPEPVVTRSVETQYVIRYYAPRPVRPDARMVTWEERMQIQERLLRGLRDELRELGWSVPSDVWDTHWYHEHNDGVVEVRLDLYKDGYSATARIFRSMPDHLVEELRRAP